MLPGTSRADIDVMRDRAGPTAQPLVVEHGADHVDVRQMLAAREVRIVTDEHVARRDAAFVLADEVAHLAS